MASPRASGPMVISLQAGGARGIGARVGRIVVIDVNRRRRQCGSECRHDLGDGRLLVVARDENGNCVPIEPVKDLGGCRADARLQHLCVFHDWCSRHRPGDGAHARFIAPHTFEVGRNSVRTSPPHWNASPLDLCDPLASMVRAAQGGSTTDEMRFAPGRREPSGSIAFLALRQ